MASRFHSSLINNSFGDPGLLIQFLHKKRAFLFDIGDISSLQIRKVLSITHVFVSHTHIDHFFGFDRMLRLSLGRKKKLHIYGPPGLFHNTEGKLGGYHWNLVNKYIVNFEISVTEVHNNYTATRTYQSKNRFKPSQEKQSNIQDNIIFSDNTLEIRAMILDHGIPCLGFSLQERPKIKILSENIKSMGLMPGPWINHLKHRLQSQIDKKEIFQISSGGHDTINVNLKNLKKKITQTSPGDKITYITDVSYNDKNKKAILRLAYKSTHLFIEASFVTEQKKMAIEKHHLTAKQAGQIARMSKSKKYTLFHHSPRYIRCPDRLKLEAEIEFRK